MFWGKNIKEYKQFLFYFVIIFFCFSVSCSFSTFYRRERVYGDAHNLSAAAYIVFYIEVVGCMDGMVCWLVRSFVRCLRSGVGWGV